MIKYPKIQTVFKRDPATRHKTLLLGVYATAEFAYLERNQWVFTEKVDGTNIRININPDDPNVIIFGGRTDNAQLPARLHDALDRIFRSQRGAMREKFMHGAILFGEGYGAKIQKGGGKYRQDQGFVLFDVNIDGIWLERNNVEEIADALALEIVPIIGLGTLEDMVALVSDGSLLSEWGSFLAEGIVARPLIELLRRNGERVITKIKRKDFVHND